jgi:hypothetical protein
MGQAGYNPNPLWNEMATMINRDKTELDRVAAENYWSPSSTEYKQLEYNMLIQHAKWADENGMLDEFALTQAAPYERVIAAGAHNGNASFEGIASEVRHLEEVIKAEGLSLGGSTELARRMQQYLFQKIDSARQTDAQFDSIMDQAEIAMAPAGRDRAVGYEMYFKMFLDYFGPTPYVQY